MKIQIEMATNIDRKRINPELIDIYQSICKANANASFYLSLPYGLKLWDNDKFLNHIDKIKDEHGLNGNGDEIGQFIKFIKNCQYPVGLVLKGGLEVYRNYQVSGQKDTIRKNSDTILKRGDFFGLFEAFADLHGQHIIAVGLQSFFISNSIGDSKHSGFLSEEIKHINKSPYNFNKLIDDVNMDEWKTECLFFNPKEITNKELINNLLKFTNKQLVSLLNQNPQITFCDSYELDYADIRFRSRTLDAMIDGYMPIYSLATEEDEEYFPINYLKNKIKNEKIGKSLKKGEEIDIWIPSLLNFKNRKVGAYFPKLSNRTRAISTKGTRYDELFELFDINSSSSLHFSKISDGRTREIIPNSGKKSIMEWTTKNSKTKARIFRYDYYGKNNFENIHQIYQKFQPEFKRDTLGYSWPKHINASLVIELLKK